MNLNPRKILSLAGFVLASAYCVPLLANETHLPTNTHIEYSRDPETVIVSFREIFPEFADQDSTPLLRIYGDGRVVVFHPSYMKRAGQYEMMMSRGELEKLLFQLTPILMNFNPKNVKAQKKASDDLLWSSASDWRDVTIFYDSDAEISVFNVNIDAYQHEGKTDRIITKPKLERSWRGLRFDARDYMGIEPIQELMQAETILRAFTKRNELVKVD